MDKPIDYFDEAVMLLQQLITTPSISKEEEHTANILEDYLIKKGRNVERWKNNIYSGVVHSGKPTVLLNSHHDTVKPVTGWTKDPFGAEIIHDKLYGLGANDAGASLVCLLLTYLKLADKDLPFNLVFLASAEEEISGKSGVEYALKQMKKPDFAIVGEPTEMKLAIAEKGLMVIDGLTQGKSGHAARNEGENALYKALDDIQKLRQIEFEKVSEILGPVKVTVTQISSGTQHNVIPDTCQFVVDVRTNECYTNLEVFEIMQGRVNSNLKARSFRLNSSGILPQHPVIRCASELQLDLLGSPTLSDQALMDFPSVKIGPGRSERSHTADEYVRLDEMAHALTIYENMLVNLKL